jgi:hypothetical protein
MLKLVLAAAALGLGAGAAHAQTAPASPAPAGPGLMGENSAARNGGDTSDRDAARARDEAIAKARSRDGGKARTPRTVPATPQDVVAGAEVRDAKGVHVGVIESVSLAGAILKADGGAVEVPLEAFGKDAKGLLIGMAKADFDKLVAQATQQQ